VSRRENWGKTAAHAATIISVMTDATADRGADGSAERPSVDWQSALATHDRWLRTVVLARLGERGAVDDVMQEVSLAAVAQRAPINDAAKVAPWLYRLAVTQSLLYRRRRGRGRKLADRYAQRNRPSEIDARAADPLDWLLAAERRDLVRAALARLPRREAEILLLKYTHDWSYHAIAAHLGISHSAVETRLHRARQRMREVLAAVGAVEIKTAEVNAVEINP
jgi:RNA polymerase sigma-70 factor, ECF subfamily